MDLPGRVIFLADKRVVLRLVVENVRLVEKKSSGVIFLDGNRWYSRHGTEEFWWDLSWLESGIGERGMRNLEYRGKKGGLNGFFTS